MKPDDLARVRALIAARRSTERARTTWDGDTRGREMVATTDALEALVAAVEPLTEQPSIESGDIYRFSGRWYELENALWAEASSEVDRIIKADGRQWRKPDAGGQ